MIVNYVQLSFLLDLSRLQANIVNRAMRGNERLHTRRVGFDDPRFFSVYCNKRSYTACATNNTIDSMDKNSTRLTSSQAALYSEQAYRREPSEKNSLINKALKIADEIKPPGAIASGAPVHRDVHYRPTHSHTTLEEARQRREDTYINNRDIQMRREYVDWVNENTRLYNRFTDTRRTVPGWHMIRSTRSPPPNDPHPTHDNYHRDFLSYDKNWIWIHPR